MRDRGCVEHDACEGGPCQLEMGHRGDYQRKEDEPVYLTCERCGKIYPEDDEHPIDVGFCGDKCAWRYKHPNGDDGGEG